MSIFRCFPGERVPACPPILNHGEGLRMVRMDKLQSYIDELLDVAAFSDYAPNGLQVAGRSEVNTLVSGVTACQALLEAAVAAKADAVLVHHGYFWKSEDPRVVGMKYHRLKMLLDHGIALLAYHLPLDAHPTLGNNAGLAAALGFQVEGRFGSGPGEGLAVYGEVSAMPAAALAAKLASALGRAPLHIEGGTHSIRRVGWCSGAAQGYLEEAARLGLDAYISGEISEPTVHMARELGVHYFAAGHHATERFGVQALGQYLADKFDISHKFIDIENPV
jgi:dinuclear metal center YbgI/SA1388 family protein